MYRKFKFINELGKEWDLTDYHNYCFLRNPAGLGYSKELSFYRLEDKFVLENESLVQGTITGELIFKNYDKYYELIKYIEESEELRLYYFIPKESGYDTYYKEIVVETINKGEKDKTGILICDCSLKSTNNWRKEEILFVNQGENSEEREARWDFNWNPYLKEYLSSTFMYENNSHTEASFSIKIKGRVTNPRIKITDDKGNIQTDLTINGIIEHEEVLKYSTIPNDLHLEVKKKNGTLNLFQQISLDTLNFKKLKKGVSKIEITADTDIKGIEIRIYPEYKTV